MEWCLDWAPAANTDVLTYGGKDHDVSLQCSRFDATDPAGYASGAQRVIRGGSCGVDAVKGTAGYRLAYPDTMQLGYLGIRLVCYPEGVTPAVGWITPSGE